MMTVFSRLISLVFVAAMGTLLPAQPNCIAAGYVDVGLELVLAVDTSASVDSREYRLQTIGIARALRDEEVVSAIESLGGRGIAITLVHWSENAVQPIAWTHVPDRASAIGLAAAVEGTPRSNVGATTAIGSAIAFSSALIASNEFIGRRRSIDISGDGKSNSGLPTWGERIRAVEAGITINGLAVLDDDPSLEAYYREHVIAGPGAFAIAAIDFDDFARAFREKLLREIREQVATLKQPARAAAFVLGRE